MTNLYIPILLGTAREGRQSEKVAEFIFWEAKKYRKFETELIDVRNFVSLGKTEAMSDEKAKEWSEIMARADGLVIVSPEYNHGYPGELKLMLDQIYDEYYKKPVGICGVSSGGIGGARAVEMLRLVTLALEMIPVRSEVYFSNVKNLFDESGKIKDSSYDDRLKKFFDELVWYGEALKEAKSLD